MSMSMSTWRAVISEIVLCKLLISLVHLIWDKLTVGSLGNEVIPLTLVLSMLTIFILRVLSLCVLHAVL